MKKPKALILKADGINREEDLKFAFNLAGGDAKIVHVNDLRSKNDKLSNYQIIGIPGGFSYGDDIASGKVLATELISFFKEELQKFINRENTAIIGICNGFQVLVRTGIVPFRNLGQMDATLTNNNSGHFECRWIRVMVEPDSNSKFFKNMENEIFWYPVAHGEGRFFADKKVLSVIEKEKLVTFRYVDENGKPTQKYPDNPNGSINAIAGITDKTGRVLGLMPHPEAFVRREQHPNWRRREIKYAHGLPLFKNIVEYIKKIV